MKKSKNLLEGLKPLKQIFPDQRMPSIFDLYWDVKYGRDIHEHHLNNKDFLRILSENGFDTKNIRIK
jgi:hypothetical protein